MTHRLGLIRRFINDALRRRAIGKFLVFTQRFDRPDWEGQVPALGDKDISALT